MFDRNVKKYLLDSNLELILDVKIANKGEDAFESAFYITIPDGVHFNKITEEHTETRISCSRVATAENVVQCDIGNPLPASRIV